MTQSAEDRVDTALALAGLKEQVDLLIVQQAAQTDAAARERTAESIAMLKLVALGMEDIRAGRTIPFKEAITRLKSQRPPTTG